MIRDLVRRAARRLLGRTATGNAPPTPRPEPERQGAAPRPEPEAEEPQLEIEAPRLKEWLGDDRLVLLDIREPGEVQHGHAEGALLIPMNQVPHRMQEIPKGRRIVVYCAAGARSFGVTGYLREHGYPDSWSLIGGFGAFVGEGGRHLRPPVGSRFTITSRVRITRDPLEVDGVAVPPKLRTGTIQEIQEVNGASRYAIGLLDEGGVPFLVRDIRDTELERP
jgi:rhodanese-related sulfurtransferase